MWLCRGVRDNFRKQIPGSSCCLSFVNLLFPLLFIQVKSDFSKVNERLGGFCLSFVCFPSPFPHSLPSFSSPFFGLLLFRCFFQSSLIYRASRCCGLDIFIKTQSLPLNSYPLYLITAEWAGDKARGNTEKTEHCSSPEQMRKRCIYLRNIWVNNILSFISYGVPKGMSESILVTTYIHCMVLSFFRQDALDKAQRWLMDEGYWKETLKKTL